MSVFSRTAWVISDTHFNHENIIKYCSRPFSSAEEMNECLVDHWNSVVRDEDLVYHLGDVYMGGGFSRDYTRSLLSRLKGRKRLILGNHDTGKDDVLRGAFQKIDVWRKKPMGLPCILTHIPVHVDTLDENKAPINVHGHIHTRVLPDKRYINVSVEQINYTPVNLEELCS